MIFPGGRGYFRNPDSSARDKSYTLLRPGRAGGLTTGRFQPTPRPAFTSSGDSRAALDHPARPASPTSSSAWSTQARDPQSGRSVPPPRITAVGRRLSGQVHALTAAWNKLYFNQGSPKPGSSRPLVTGSYNPRTRAFTLVWRSRIKGGPFNGFTGLWHLAGKFRPRGGAGAAAAAKKEKLTGRKRCRSKKFKAKHRRYCKRKRAATPPPGSQELVGLFRLDGGSYTRAGGPEGSYFRMVFPDGTAARGPYFGNGSSASADQTLTPISPGTDGGFTTGAYQPPPDPAFTGRGDALANRVIQPQRFAGVNFSVSTSPRDIQTGIDVPAPKIVAHP